MTRIIYEIRLRGQLAPEVAANLAVRAVTDVPAETVLLSPRVDQAGVHRLIDRLRDFGLPLIGLRRCPEGPRPPARSQDDSRDG